MEVLDLLETQGEATELEQLIQRIEEGDMHLSYSSIKQFMRSPRHFISYKMKEFKPTAAMNEGTLVDMLLTEPENVHTTFGVIPENCNKSSKEGLANFADFLGIPVPDWKSRTIAIDGAIEASGKTYIDQAVWDKCHNIADKVCTNPASAWILKNGEEKQYPVNFEAFGWKWRGKMDLYCPEFFIADLKKTADADPYRFHRQVRNLKYDLQAAIYNHGLNVPYFLVAYDNDAAVSVTELKQSAMEQAWNNLARVMEKFNECVAMGEWHKSYDFWPSNYHGIYTY